MSDPIGFQITMLLTTKSTLWAYEREWRIVDYQTCAGVRKLPPDALLGAILGRKIAESERNRIWAWVEQREQPTELPQARERESGVVFQPL